MVAVNDFNEFGPGADALERLTDDDDTTGVRSFVSNDMIRFQFVQSPIHLNRLGDEFALRARFSRGNNSLANVELSINDGVTTFGSEVVSVAGSGPAFIEQVLNVKINSLRNLQNLNFDVFNRTVL